MKLNNNIQLRVGIFIFTGLVILCLSVFFWGGSELLKARATYKIRFPQSQGLQIGSVVSLAGINIGNIIKIELLPAENTVEVTLNIDAKFVSHITEGTEADIRTQGALGDKYIYIKPGSPQNKIIPEHSIIPIIPSFDLIAFINEKGDQATKIFDILNDVHKITQAMTQENQFGKLMANSESTITQLRKTLEETEKLVKDARGASTNDQPSKIAKTMDHLDHILSRLDKGEGTLGALLTDSTIHERIKNILGADSKNQGIRSLLRNSLEHNNDDKNN